MSKISTYTLLSFATKLTDRGYSDAELKQLRLHNTAHKFAAGNQIKYSLTQLQKTNFWKQNNYVFLQSKGVGYWLWKPFIIKETLEKLNDGEILIYADGSFYFIDSPLKLAEYIDPHSDFGFFEDRNHTLQQSIHDEAIKQLDIAENVLRKNIIIAGLIVIRKSKNSIDFINKWLKLCVQPTLLMDDYKQSSRKEFVQHKNDMALLSYLVHKHEISYSIPPTISQSTGFLENNIEYPDSILNWDKNGFGCKRPLVHYLSPNYLWAFFRKKYLPKQ